MFTQQSGHRALRSSQAPVAIILYLRPPVTPPFPPSSNFFLFFPAWNDFFFLFFFFAIHAKATLPCSDIAMGYAPPPQVGQPNWAIRQDIHHYPVGWSKWPWCSLHTQFQIPLGSIMGRFKQREHGRPSHLILTMLDVISVWCCSEKESNMGGTERGEMERVSQQVMKAQRKIKME